VAVAVPVGVGVAVGVDVPVGDGVTTTTAWQSENSDVLPLGSVAVAVTTPVAPVGRVALRTALPEPSVVAVVAPRNVWPSPKKVASQAALAKNSIRKIVLAVLLSEPVTVVLAPSEIAEVRTGKF
jgi:hypothetical protein